MVKIIACRVNLLLTKRAPAGSIGLSSTYCEYLNCLCTHDIYECGLVCFIKTLMHESR